VWGWYILCVGGDEKMEDIMRIVEMAKQADEKLGMASRLA